MRGVEICCPGVPDSLLKVKNVQLYSVAAVTLDRHSGIGLVGA